MRLSLQIEAQEAGLDVIDLGAAAKKEQGFRYLAQRNSDGAFFHLNSVAQLRSMF